MNRQNWNKTYDTKTVRNKAFDAGYGVKRKSKCQEDRVAKELNAFRQPASGALDGMKGDVKHDDFLIEAKRTDSNVLPVSTRWLKKITKEAEEIGKVPALTLEWGDMFVGVEKDWIVIPLSVFKELIGGNK